MLGRRGGGDRCSPVGVSIGFIVFAPLSTFGEMPLTIKPSFVNNCGSYIPSLKKDLQRGYSFLSFSHSPVGVKLAPAANAETDVPAVGGQYKWPNLSYRPKLATVGQHGFGDTRAQGKR